MKDFLFKILDTELFDKIKEELSILYERTEPAPGRFRILDKDATLNLLPTVVKWFQENNLEVRQVAYISLAGHTSQQAHVDSGEPQLALNFPVINCDEVVTEFFKLEEQDLTIQYTVETNLPYHHFDSTDKDPIGSFSLTQPTLLNIKMPHRVVNNTDSERISLSFRFKNDPWHLI